MARPVQSDLRTRLQEWIPKIVLAPSVASMLIFVYGFIVFTGYLSFTNSRILPSFDQVVFHDVGEAEVRDRRLARNSAYAGVVLVIVCDLAVDIGASCRD